MSVINGDNLDNNLNGTANDDTINGFGGNDIINADAGADSVDGGDGNDLITGGDGDDSLLGGTGTDNISGNAGADTLEGGADNDTLNGGTENDSLSGGTENDVLIGGLGDDTLEGGDGNDTLSLTDDQGNDSLSGGLGNDNIQDRDGDNTVFGGEGNDFISVSGTEIHGDGGNDTIDAYYRSTGGTPVSITGGDGNDSIRMFDTAGAGQVIVVDAGAGDDTVQSWFTNSSEVIRGGDGNDILNASSGDDTLEGGTGNDTLRGDNGADSLLGEDGDDFLEGGQGNDTLDGGADNSGAAIPTAGDVAFFNAPRANFLLFKDPGGDIRVVDIIGSLGTDVVRNVEVLRFSDMDVDPATLVSGSEQTGTAAGEALNGTAGTDSLDGAGGNDTITGLGDTDVLLGGDGNDEISGGDGRDSLRGGADDDTIAGDGGDDLLFGDTGADDLDGGAGADTLNGGTENDSLSGGTENDVLIGGLGDDTLEGGDGNDTLSLTDDQGNDSLSGGLGNDNIQDRDGDNTVFGGEGNDFISVSGTEIHGDGGNDTIDAYYRSTGGTPVSITGGDGNDSIRMFDTAGAGQVIVVDAGAGDDTVQSWFTNSSEVIRGGDGNDILNASSGDDTLEGGTGNDTLRGDNGADSLSGGDGDDLLTGGSGNDTIDGGDGTDTMSGGSGDDSIDGFTVGGGGDVVTFSGNIANYIITPGALGNATVEDTVGSDGTDTISNVSILRFADGDVVIGNNPGVNQVGTVGDDSFVGSSGNDTQTGDLGNDTLIGLDGNDSQSGDAGADSLLGGLGEDTLDGGAGNDTLNAGSQNDSLSGGTENDVLIGGLGDDTLEGGDGNDTLSLTDDQGNDSLSGGLGNDNIQDRDGDNTVFGGEGNDFISVSGTEIHGDGGNDTIDAYYRSTGGTPVSITGGDGNDSIRMFDTAGAGQVIVVDAGAGDDTVQSWFTNSSEVIRGGDGNDILNASSGDDTLEGGTGNDTLRGDNGADSLLGEDGDDFLEGGQGNDTLDGGADNSGAAIPTAGDVAFFNAPRANFLLFKDPGGDIRVVDIIGSLGTDVVRNVEVLRFSDMDVDPATLVSGSEQTGTAAGEALNGTAGTDSLDGAGGNDTITGLGDTDVLLGGDGNDEISGGDGRDSLRGGADDDTIAGDGGDDLLFGDTGADDLDGGAGADTLNGGTENDSLSGGTENDVLIGGLGDDTLEGGDGNDTLSLTDDQGNDSLSGGLGNDNIQDRDGDNTVFGGEGNDFISVSGTEIHGDGGNDTIDAYYRSTGGTPVSITGGDGNDSIRMFDTAGAGQVIVVDAGAGDDTVQSWFTNSSEVIRGGDGNDILNASSGDDTLEGGTGNDTLRGDNGADSLSGGDGDDLLTGGSGNDTIDGGTDGSNDPIPTDGDTAVYSGPRGNYSLIGTTSGLQVINQGNVNGDGSDLLFNIERLQFSDGIVIVGTEITGTTVIGGPGDDNGGSGNPPALIGTVVNDTIEGRAGDDLLIGLGGEDSMLGEEGNDTLEGGNNDDTLDGGADDDTLDGGTGDDLLRGGTGENTAVYAGNRADFTISGTIANTTVTDNNLADGNEGTDSLENIRIIEFADETFFYNTAPNAVDDTAVISEDTSVDIPKADLLLNDGDAENDALSVVGVQNPVNGTVQLLANDVRFTPAADFNGAASFEVVVSDGFETSVSRVDVTVNAVNDAPVAVNDTFSTDEDTPVDIAPTLNDTDVDSTISLGSPVAFSDPAGGTLTRNPNGSLKFTPDADFNGDTTFTYTVSDGLASSNTATVTITVNPVNDDPTAVSDIATTAVNTPVDIDVALNDTDIDGDTLFPTAVGVPTSGTASINDNGTPGDATDDFITYTPFPGATGQDSFTYTVSDGNGGTDTATVTVDVVQPNRAPTLVDDPANVDESGLVTIDLLGNDSDLDGDTLIVTGIDTSGVTGFTRLNPDGTVTYNPFGNFAGLNAGESATESFTYTVSDGITSETATATVTIDGQNQAPTPNSSLNLSQFTAYGGSSNWAVAADNLSVLQTVNGAPTAYVSNQNFLNSTFEGAFSVRTSSDDDYMGFVFGFGADASAPFYLFDWKQANQSGAAFEGFTLARVTGGFGAIPFSPHGQDKSGYDVVDTLFDTSLGWQNFAEYDFRLTYNVDSMKIEVGGTGPFGPGLATIFEAAPSDFGLAQFDPGRFGFYNYSQSQVRYSGFAQNTAPVANDDTATTDEDTPLTILSADIVSNDTDSDGDSLTVNSVSNAVNGSVVLDGSGNVVFTPDSDFFGTATFDVEVTDGVVSDTSRMTVTVNPVNDAPVAADDTATTQEDNAINIAVLDNDMDVEDGVPTGSIVVDDSGADGSATVEANGTITFTPDADFFGTTSFTYTVLDSDGAPGTGTVTVTVTPVNDDPTANDDTATVEAGQSVDIDVAANDTDIDGDDLFPSAVGAGLSNLVTSNGGTVSINDNGTAGDTTDDLITYLADAGFTGTDTFTYTVSDGDTGTSTATVTVTVTPPNQDPTALGDAATTAEDSSVDIDVLDNDTDLDGDPLSVSGVTQGANGSVVILANGELRYTPNADFNGNDSFTYTVSDGKTGTSTATVNVTVDPVNDAPDTVDDTSTGAEDTAQIIDVLANDPVDTEDGVKGEVIAVGGSSFGTTQINPDGTITFTPNLNFVGTIAPFTYTVQDQDGATSIGQVRVTVTPVDDAPTAVDNSVATAFNKAVTVDVIANDSDPDDNDEIFLAGLDQANGPSNGVAIILDGGTPGDASDDIIQYTPNAGFTGTDTFDYVVEDEDGLTSTATVTVQVGGPLPDLTLSNVVLSDNTVFGEQSIVQTPAVFVSYDITNQGAADSVAFFEKLVWSKDLVISADDIVAREVSINQGLTAGQTVNRQVQVDIPDYAGDLNLLVQIDSNKTVVESIESNNLGSTTATITPEFTATITSTSVSAAPLDGTFTIFGNATGNYPTATPGFEFVVIDATLNGVTRSFTTQTDLNGNFSVQYPAFGTITGGGTLELFARSPVDPQEDNGLPAEATVDLFGFDFDAQTTRQSVIEGQSTTFTLDITNLSSTPMTNITSAITSLDPRLTVTDITAPTSLAGDGTGTVSVTVQAAPGAGSIISADTFGIELTSQEGAVADAVVDMRVIDEKPDLVLSVPRLNEAMALGEQTLLSFEVTNEGGLASGPIDVILPTTTYNMTLVTPAVIPNLNIGQSATVTVQLAPAADLPIAQYSSSIVLQAAEDAASLPFTFTATTDVTADLLIEVTDDLTYLDADQPLLNDATVVLFDQFTGQEVARNEDVDGTFTFQDLPLGFYRMEVSADGHASRTYEIEVKAGNTNSFEAFLPTEMVKYSFTVTEIEIEDRYEVDIQADFRTNVPVPVLEVSPQVIDLSAVPDIGDTTVINMTLTNRGLIAMNDIELNLGEHAYYDIIPDLDRVDWLDAQTSITIPVTVTRTAFEPGESTKCYLGGNIFYDYKLVDRDGDPETGPEVTSYVPIGYVNVDGDCPPSDLPPIVFGGSSITSGFGGPGGSVSAGGSGRAVPINPVVTTPPVTVDQGVEVEIRVAITQDLVLTRQGFEGLLEISNFDDEAITDVEVEIVIYDGAGQAVGTGIFGILDPEIEGLTAVDGTGVLAAGQDGSALFTIVPSKDAAPDENTDYTIGGNLRYTENGGEQRDIQLTGTSVTVVPTPEIHLDYFWQRNVFADDPFSPEQFFDAPQWSPYPGGVEPNIPGDFGVLVSNLGAGTARDLFIESAQPVIIDNEQGLLIDFDLLGTEVNGTPIQPTLTAEFGDLEGGENAVAVWQLQSSLQGRFLNFDATFRNTGILSDNPELSVVQSVTVHELVQTVLDTRTGADALPDFLVNSTEPDPDNPDFLPDTLYTSEGTVEAVTVGTVVVLDDDLSDLDMVVQITGGADWTYALFDGPNLLDFQVQSVTRADGSIIALDNIWQTDRTFPESGRPAYEDKVHILDYLGGVQTYTITFADLDPNTAPVAQDDAFSLPAGGSLVGASLFADNGNGADSDADGDPLTVTLVNGLAAPLGQTIALASGASLSVRSDGTFDYDPNGHAGSDSFTYTISDGARGFDTATVTVNTSAPPNTQPVAQDDSFSLGAGSTIVNGDLLADNGNGADFDADGDPLTVQQVLVSGIPIALGTSVTLASGADLTVRSDGTFDYDPKSFVGTDTFTYLVEDGQGATAPADVTITTSATPNTPPVAQDDRFTVPTDASILNATLFGDNGNGADSDADGDALSITEVDGVAASVGQTITLGSGAELTVRSDGTFDYDPNGFAGTDNFTYEITDGNGGFDTADASILSSSSSGVGQRNVFQGTEGATDTFVLGDTDKDHLRNVDLNDRFDLRSWGVQSFEELEITDRGPLLTIKDMVSGSVAYAYDRADLDPDADEFSADNFIFAPLSSLTVTDQKATSEQYSGRAGDDLIQTGAGFNSVFGRGGADTFEIGAGGSTILRDFTNGVDKIDLSDWGVTDFADLSVREVNGKIRVEEAGERLRIDTGLTGLSLGDIDASDFVGL